MTGESTVTRQNTGLDAPLQRHCEEVAGREMTGAVRALGSAAVLMRATDKQAWAAGIEKLAAEAKRILDAMYAEQEAMQNV